MRIYLSPYLIFYKYFPWHYAGESERESILKHENCGIFCLGIDQDFAKVTFWSLILVWWSVFFIIFNVEEIFKSFKFTANLLFLLIYPSFEIF